MWGGLFYRRNRERKGEEYEQGEGSGNRGGNWDGQQGSGNLGGQQGGGNWGCRTQGSFWPGAIGEALNAAKKIEPFEQGKDSGDWNGHIRI